MDNTALRKISVGSYYLILDQVVNYGLGALFWLLLAKLVSPTIIGQIMLVNALTIAVLGFAGYGAQVTISKYIAEYNAKKAYDASRKVLAKGLRIGLIVSGIAALLLSIFSGQLAVSIYNDATLVSLIIIAMLAVLPTQTVMSCFNGSFHGSQKMKYTTIIDAVYQVFRLLIAVVLVLGGLGGLGIILGFAFGSVIAVLLGYTLFVRKLFSKKAASSRFDLGHIAKFSGFNYLAIGISTLALQTSYLMLGMQAFNSVALFGISSLISGVVGGIIISVGKAVLPTASAELETGDNLSLNSALNLALRISLMMSGFIYIPLMVSPDQILGLLSRDYIAASDILRILVLSSILASLSAFIGSVLNGLGRPKSVAKVAVASSLVVISASISLIPFSGILGAAIATLLGSIVSLSTSLYFISRQKTIIMSPVNVLKPVLAIASALAIGFFAMTFTWNTVIILVLSVGGYIGLIGLSRVTTRSEMRSFLQYATRIAAGR